MNSQFRDQKSQRLIQCIIKSFFVRKLFFSKTLEIQGSFSVFTDSKLAVIIDLNENFRKSRKSGTVSKLLSSPHQEQTCAEDPRDFFTHQNTEISSITEEPQVKIEMDEAYGGSREERTPREATSDFFGLKNFENHTNLLSCI